MADIHTINFIDIKRLEDAALAALVADINLLQARKDKHIPLSPADEATLARLVAIRDLKGKKYVDPLFVGVRSALRSEDTGLKPVEVEHEADGTLLFAKLATDDEKNLAAARTALVLGLLQLEKAPLAIVKVDGKEVVSDKGHENAPLFEQALFQAIGRVAGHLPLARRVLQLLAGAVSLGHGAREEVGVSTFEFARVFTTLVEQRITEKDPNLKRLVEDSLDRVQEIGQEPPLHEFEIKLPDLEEKVALVIEAEHCKLFGCFIFASAFEELRAFQVVDTLIDMSQRGNISLTRGKAGTQLYNYWRAAPNRMSENERQTFYAMTLGLPTGQPGIAVNSDFQDLWLRFVSSVSTLVRERRVDQLLRSDVPQAINQQRVKKAARDLAVNMSAHGFGMVFYAAADLQKQINEIIQLLDDSDVKAAFGARDMWGVIDQIAQTELGGARNSSKYRMLATSGAIITSWIARNLYRLHDPTLSMVDMNDVMNPPSRPSGASATSAPTDYDLVNACEMWLADSAMDEDRVELMSQPRESPQQTSRPIQIPSAARDLLEGAGLGLGVGLGLSQRPASSGHLNGQANGHAANGRGRYAGY